MAKRVTPPQNDECLMGHRWNRCIPLRHNRSLWLDIGIVYDVYGKSRYVQLWSRHLHYNAQDIFQKETRENNEKTVMIIMTRTLQPAKSTQRVGHEHVKNNISFTNSIMERWWNSSNESHWEFIISPTELCCSMLLPCQRRPSCVYPKIRGKHEQKSKGSPPL